jgi:type II secretory pathway pseudopilin PulG
MSGERGETSIVGLLVAMIIFAVVLGATLTTFAGGTTATRQANERAEAADRARDAIDRVGKSLRNLASPRADDGAAITTAGPYDIVFKTVAPAMPSATGNLNVTNTKRVRYCLAVTDPTRARLYEQTQTWTTQAAPGPPAPGACGAAGSGWTRTEVIADRITNVIGGRDRPLFTYASAADATVSTAIHLDLFVDPDPRSPAPETELSSGVYLRNQNRPPKALFTPTVVGSGILLNGSASADPEGETLDYTWTDNGTVVGSGITFLYSPSGPVTERVIGLTVSDGKLTDTSTQRVPR